MGIRRLKRLLSNLCINKGIYHFPSVRDFIVSEKRRFYKRSSNECNNPIKCMQIKKKINDSPYIVGIDTNLYIAKYSRIFKKIEYGFLRQILLSVSSGILPVYIFDGSSPVEKKDVVDKRFDKRIKCRDKLNHLLNCKQLINKDLLSSDKKIIEYINSLCNRDGLSKEDGMASLIYDTKMIGEQAELFKLYQRSINITPTDIHNLKNFFDMMHIPYIVANNEADDMLAYLYDKKIIHACQSDDMDMLPKGCGNVIQITNTGVTQYLLEEILDELNLTKDQFIDICILLGSDYYTAYLPKIDPTDLYNIFVSLKPPNLENFISYYTAIDPSISEHLEPYLNVRKSFNTISSEYLDKIPKISLIPFSINRIIDHLQLSINHKDIMRLKTNFRNANNYIYSLARKRVR